MPQHVAAPVIHRSCQSCGFSSPTDMCVTDSLLFLRFVCKVYVLVAPGRLCFADLCRNMSPQPQPLVRAHHLAKSACPHSGSPAGHTLTTLQPHDRQLSNLDRLYCYVYTMCGRVIAVFVYGTVAQWMRAGADAAYFTYAPYWALCSPLLAS
jgi:hypothetical protein